MGGFAHGYANTKNDFHAWTLPVAKERVRLKLLKRKEKQSQAVKVEKQVVGPYERFIWAAGPDGSSTLNLSKRVANGRRPERNQRVSDEHWKKTT